MVTAHILETSQEVVLMEQDFVLRQASLIKGRFGGIVDM